MPGTGLRKIGYFAFNPKQWEAAAKQTAYFTVEPGDAVYIALRRGQRLTHAVLAGFIKLRSSAQYSVATGQNI
jgi:hypothetical protein